MNTKVFILLTFFGICFGKNVVEEFTTKNNVAHQSDDKASVRGDAVTFKVWYSVGFTDAESAYAAYLAGKAREWYSLSALAQLTAYLRDMLEGAFGGYWNCMAVAFQGQGYLSGWRAQRYIHLVAQTGYDQFFMCSQGCNSGNCTKFGGIV